MSNNWTECSLPDIKPIWWSRANTPSVPFASQWGKYHANSWVPELATGTSLDLPPAVHMAAGLWYRHEEIILGFPKRCNYQGAIAWKKIKLYSLPPKVTVLRRFQSWGFRLLVEDLLSVWLQWINQLLHYWPFDRKPIVDPWFPSRHTNNA